MSEPARNQNTIGHTTDFHCRMSRLVFEPSWATPCTGMTAAGGNAAPMIASSASPPPRPNAAVSDEVKKLATMTAIAAAAETPSGRSALSRLMKERSSSDWRAVASKASMFMVAAPQRQSPLHENRHLEH